MHSLVCLLRSLLLTSCSVIVQTSSTIWQFFWTEWPEDHKNRCLSYSTNSGDQIRFVHGDHLKSACCIQSSSSWEGGEDSNYARNLLSSSAAVQSGAWSPSEPLVSTSEARGNLDAGDVEEQETTELTPERSLGDALDGPSPSGAPLPMHPAPQWWARTRVGRGDHHADSYVKCEHSLSRWRTLNIVYLLDLHLLFVVVMLTNSFVREDCNILGSRLLVFFHMRSALKMEDQHMVRFVL